ncbi:MAG TPA: hypothetical protein VF574_10500 [Allosphingosinicella sp.]
MTKLFLAALLAAAAGSVQAQPTSPAAPINPSLDSAQDRKALQKMSACLAKARPRWARQMLAKPYLSDGQSFLAGQALVGRDGCVVGPEAEVVVRPATLAGSLAEHFVRTDIQKAGSQRLAGMLNQIAPLNASEDFGLCVASRDLAAARELTLSEPGSDSEERAARRLAAFVGPCTNPGESLTVDLQSLRALVATALYRGVSAVLTSRS